MARAKKASEVSPAKAAVLGADVLIPNAGSNVVDDGRPVQSIEPIDYDTYWAEEDARRQREKEERAAAWKRLGRVVNTTDGSAMVGAADEKPTPLRGSVCSRCGATNAVLYSQQASGPYVCAFGCSG